MMTTAAVPPEELLLGRAAVEALDARIAVVDGEGIIVAVNGVWEAFARATGGADGLSRTSVGASYFDVCRRDPAAQRLIDRFQQVLRGEAPRFEFEYPCHAPDREHWFLMRVTPLDLGSWRGLLVAHFNVTERVLAADAQQLAEKAGRRALALERLGEVGSLVAARTSAQSYGVSALREVAPRLFEEMVGRYKTLLEQALESSTFNVDQPSRTAVRELADDLGFVAARPRDVIDLHREALVRALAAGASDDAALADEGRLLALQLMGDLAAYYRARAVGLQLSPEAAASSR